MHGEDNRNSYNTFIRKPKQKRLVGKIILKWVLKKYDLEVWTGFNWLKLESISGLLWTWWWTIRFHKRWDIIPQVHCIKYHVLMNGLLAVDHTLCNSAVKTVCVLACTYISILGKIYCTVIKTGPYFHQESQKQLFNFYLDCFYT
jgi:hypothetical protein